MDFFSNIVSYIETGALHGGYFFLLLISVIEAVPLIGTTVPGHTAVILSGFLVRLGIFNIWIVIALASLGAITGDLIGYMAGKKYGMKLLDKYGAKFYIKPQHIEKTKQLINRHTGKALILGRFNPITRPLMPFIVGTSQVSDRTFWVFNIIGGVLWSISSILVGYIFGYGYETGVKYFGTGVIIAIIATVLIIWGYKFVNVRFHIFRKYELFALIFGILSVWGLIKTIEDAWNINSFMANFDIWVNQFSETVVTKLSFIGDISYLIGAGMNTYIMAGAGIVVGLIFASQKRWRSAVIMILTVCSTSALVLIMKDFFMRARPMNALQMLSDASYPSGHSAISAALFIALMYLLAPKIISVLRREIFIALCILMAVVIGLSRILINVHWFSDVIAGWSLGVLCATASILIIRYISLFLKKE